MADCPRCGSENAAGAHFCSSCGMRLGDAPTGFGSERKVVSILFVDLVGFTGRAELLDPEDVGRLLTPFYAHVRTELERFGGTVEKFIGDAVMAVFGAPTAHEDDPERAVRAGFAVRRVVDELNADDPELALRLRIGIATGEVLIDLSADPARGETTVAGDVGDHPEAYTRFVSVATYTRLDRESDDWRTAFSFVTDHSPGALHRAIEPFGRHRIDLHQLVSRPIPHTPWRYRFDAVLAGHPLDPLVKHALAELRGRTRRLHVFGSYPAGRDVGD